MPSYNGIGPIRMRCPKCQFDHPLQTTECLKCGIVFSRYQPTLETAANQLNPNVPAAVSAPPALAVSTPPALAVSTPPALAEPVVAANDALSLSRADARTELQYR
ncbi:MAG: hypothetical protein WA857_17465, partial [Candidatus Acidiferrum sp.]